MMTDFNIGDLQKQLNQRLEDISKMEAEREKLTNKKTADLKKALEKRDHDLEDLKARRENILKTYDDKKKTISETADKTISDLSASIAKLKAQANQIEKLVKQVNDVFSSFTDDYVAPQRPKRKKPAKKKTADEAKSA